MDMFLIALVVLAKLLVPALMLWWPFPAVWANYFLDVVDGDILQYLGLAESWYQTIDKSADWISYVFMIWAGWNWRIRKTLLFLFIYRTVGQLLFFLTGDEFMFVYFQNFLEPLVMIYTLLIFKLKSELKAFESYKTHIILIWGIILGYKLWNEWYLHWANIDLSTMFFGVNGGGL